jgi:hypothetical protein
MGRRFTWLPIVVIGWSALAAPAHASTRSVDCASRHGALAGAIARARAGDTLRVRGRCDGPFDVRRDLTLLGAPRATLDGRGVSTAVTVERHVRLRLVDVTVTDGSAAVGGGIFSGNPSLVVLIGSTVTGNRASSDGGGIKAGGRLQLYRSTIRGNRSGFVGGGISVGGLEDHGFSAAGKVLVMSSTVSGNRAVFAGGGIATDGNRVRVIRSTIAGNSAGVFGGGIDPIGVAAGSQVAASILAGNTAPVDADCWLAGEVLPSAGWNVAGSSCGLGRATDVVRDGGPGTFGLGAPAENGGPAWTMPLAPGSVAVDAIPPGTPFCPAGGSSDERGAHRPSGAGCDVGAFELTP